MKKIFLTPLLALSVLSLSGCSLFWPSRAHDGQAELYSQKVLTQAQRRHHVHSQLALSIQSASNRLNTIQNNGGKSCYPGLSYQSQLLSNRIVREFAGGLYQDARTNLSVLNAQIAELNHRVNRLDNIISCREK